MDREEAAADEDNPFNDAKPPPPPEPLVKGTKLVILFVLLLFGRSKQRESIFKRKLLPKRSLQVCLKAKGRIQKKGYFSCVNVDWRIVWLSTSKMNLNGQGLSTSASDFRLFASICFRRNVPGRIELDYVNHLQ